MTAQAPDQIVNQHPRVMLDGLYLYGVIEGDPRDSDSGWGEGDAVVARPVGPRTKAVCSALWRGYVAHFVLQDDGRLRLLAYEHMLEDRKWQRQEVDELLAGEFWLVLKRAFF